MTPRILFIGFAFSCSEASKPLARCETSGSLSQLDRDGDGRITPNDLEPGESAVAVLLEDAATGERIGTIYSLSNMGRLNYSNGTRPFRPWMGEYRTPPNWGVSLHVAPDRCPWAADVQVSLRRTDDPAGVLQEGRYQGPGVNFVVEEYWTKEAFEIDGSAVITEIGTDGTVSGFFDGTAEGPLFDLFAEEYTDIWVTVQGFAWRNIPGEHILQ